MSDDSSPVFRRRPLLKQPIAPRPPNSPSQGPATLAAPPPAGSSALESVVAPRIPDDNSPVPPRRPFRIRRNLPQTPDSPSQGRSKLAVPPTPDSAALVPAVLSQGQSDPASSSLHSDVGSRWKEARRHERALRRQQKEERRQMREARKRESASTRQLYLGNRFMAHQAKEVNDEDESVEGSSNSEDDGHRTDESNVTHGSHHSNAPQNIYVESMGSQGHLLGFGTPMHLQRGRARFRCYRHSLPSPLCILFCCHLTCTDHRSLHLLVSQKALYIQVCTAPTTIVCVIASTPILGATATNAKPPSRMAMQENGVRWCAALHNPLLHYVTPCSSVATMTCAPSARCRWNQAPYCPGIHLQATWRPSRLLLA